MMSILGRTPSTDASRFLAALVEQRTVDPLSLNFRAWPIAAPSEQMGG